MARRDGILCILWCGSLFLPTNSVIKNKKNFSALNVRLRFGVHSCVLSWKEILLTLGSGAQAVFGGTDPEMYTSGTGSVTFFWGTILAWQGTSCDLGGTAPKCPPPAHRA